MEAVITWVALGTGILLLATAGITLFLTLKTDRKVQKVYVLANSRMTEVIARVDQLVAALESSDTDVPPAPGHESPPREGTNQP